MLYFIVIIVFILILFVNKGNKDTFLNNLDIYSDKHITKQEYNQDNYMNFLSNINDNLKSEKGPCSVSNSLKKSFKGDNCLYKSIELSDVTNPMLYLSDSKNYPPRFLVKTLKNMPLPKNTDLKRFSNMFNCCKNNF